jgi:hypothetical protein
MEGDAGVHDAKRAPATFQFDSSAAVLSTRTIQPLNERFWKPGES